MINKYKKGEVASTLTIISLFLMLGGILAGSMFIKNQTQKASLISQAQIAFSIDNWTQSPPTVHSISQHFSAYFNNPTSSGNRWILPGSLCFIFTPPGNGKYRINLYQGSALHSNSASIITSDGKDYDHTPGVQTNSVDLIGSSFDLRTDLTKKCQGTGTKRPQYFNIVFTPKSGSNDPIYVVFEKITSNNWPDEGQLPDLSVLAVINVSGASGGSTGTATNTPAPTSDYSQNCSGLDRKISGRINVNRGTLYPDKYLKIQACIYNSTSSNKLNCTNATETRFNYTQNQTSGGEYEINYTLPQVGYLDDKEAVVLWKRFYYKGNPPSGNPGYELFRDLNVTTDLQNCTSTYYRTIGDRYAVQRIFCIINKFDRNCESKNADFVIDMSQAQSAPAQPTATPDPGQPTATPDPGQATATPDPNATSTPTSTPVPWPSDTPTPIPGQATATPDPNQPLPPSPTLVPTVIYCGQLCADYPPDVTPPTDPERCCIYNNPNLFCKSLTINNQTDDYCVRYPSSSHCTDIEGCCQPTPIPTNTPVPPSNTPTPGGGSGQPGVTVIPAPDLNLITYNFEVSNTSGQKIIRSEIESKVCRDNNYSNCANQKHTTDREEITSGNKKIISIPINLLPNTNPQYIYIKFNFVFEDNSNSEDFIFKYEINTIRSVNLFKVELQVNKNGDVIQGEISDEAKLSDINGDYCVNAVDYAKVITKYGTETNNTSNISEDINSDGIVNGFDLMYVISHFNEGSRCGQTD